MILTGTTLFWASSSLESRYGTELTIRAPSTRHFLEVVTSTTSHQNITAHLIYGLGKLNVLIQEDVFDSSLTFKPVGEELESKL